MLHVAGVEMQLTAAVSFLTVLQEESVSIHTYSHSFLHIILQHLEHRDAGQGCAAVLVTGYFYTCCFLSDCAILCKTVSAVTGTWYLALHELQYFCMLTTSILIFKHNSDWSKQKYFVWRTKCQSCYWVQLLLKYQSLVAEKTEQEWLMFLL